MKKQVFIIIILGFLCLKSYTQQQQWNWGNYASGDILQGAYNIASDANGNVYIAGQIWSSNATFSGSNPIKLAGGNTAPSMFVAKYDNYGNLIWAANASCNGADEAYSISTGSDGIYITGAYLDNEITFNNADGSLGMTLPYSTYRTFYLVKYSFSGYVKWVSWIETNENSGTAFSVTDPSGNIYITGYFTNSADLTFYSSDGSLAGTLNTRDQYNNNAAVYVASYDANGNFRWAEIAGGIDEGTLSTDYYDMGTCVTTDVSGNVYLSGYFQSSYITFSNSTDYYRKGTTLPCTPSCSPNSITLYSGGYTSGDINMFLVKFDNCGNLCNAITNDLGHYPTSLTTKTNYLFNNHESQEYWINISADNNTPGNIYMTGIFFGSLVNFNCSPPCPLTYSGNTDVFLAKFDDNLNALWATSANGDNLDFANSIHVNCDDIYITGNFNSDALTFGSCPTCSPTNITGTNAILLADYDTDGNCNWVQTVEGGGGIDYCNCSMNHGTCSYSPLTSSSSCSTIGDLESGGDYSFGVTTDILGNIDIAGFYFLPSTPNLNFSSIVNLPPSPFIPGDVNPNGGTYPDGNANIFIAQYSSPQGSVAILTSQNPAIICPDAPNNSITLTATGASSYLWSTSASTASITVSPSITTIYTVTGTTCYGTTTASVVVTVLANDLPYIVIVTNDNPSSCTSSNVTFQVISCCFSATYQWQVNGDNKGTNNSNYTYTPTDGDIVKCVVDCSGSPLTSNTITMTVEDYLPVSISIAASANSVCSGTQVTFTATPTNGGTTPSYQWRINGVNKGTNNSTYSYTPANNDIVTCKLTSSETCASGSPAISNAITMSVNPLPIANAGTNIFICSGQSALIGAPAVGSNTYSWSPSTGLSTPTDANPSAHPTVTTIYNLTETTSAGCQQMNTVVVTVDNTVSVNIASNLNPVCTGTDVTFTATPINGGPTPSYQWKVNGINVGTNSSTYTYTPLNTNVVTCVLTSSISSACTTGNQATSNSITMTVSNSLTANISINANPNTNTVCSGTQVTFTATPINGGVTPSYQWKVGTVNAGTNSSTYRYAPVNGDVVTCVLTSSETCVSNPATSNSITMTVNPLPNANVSTNTSICSGESVTIGTTSDGTGYIYGWTSTPTGFTSTVSNPSVSPYIKTTYTLTETITETGCQAANAVIVDVNSSGYEVSGFIYYDKKPPSHIINCTQVTLQNESNSFSTYAHSDGSYTVCVPPEPSSYSVTCKVHLPWGGSNSTDAAMVNSAYIGLYLFNDDLLKSAADVNGDGKINPVDALIINRRYIHLLNKFKISDWLTTFYPYDTNFKLLPDDIQVNGNMNQDIYSICAGDCNASFNPILCKSGTDQEIITHDNSNNLNFQDLTNMCTVSIDSIVTASETSVNIPIRVKIFNHISAFGFKIQYDTTILALDTILKNPNSAINGVILCHRTHDTINIAWSSESLSDTLFLNSAKLFDIHFYYIGGNSSLTFLDESSVGNDSFNDIEVNYINGNIGPLYITSQPQSTTTCAGSTASFSVSAAGTDTINYQWFKNDTIISGATNTTFNIPQVASSNFGYYKTIVSNKYGRLTSDSATLTVNSPPIINWEYLQSDTLCTGSQQYYYVYAYSYDSSPVSYQWYQNNVAITNDTNSILSFDSLTISNAGKYFCLISNNECGFTTSDTATQTIITPPLITRQPVNDTLCSSSRLILTVASSGTNPISYQWYHNDTIINGATSDKYQRTTIRESDTGRYICLVSNLCIVVTSDTATLTLLDYCKISGTLITSCTGNPVSGDTLEFFDRFGNKNTNISYVVSANGHFEFNLNGIDTSDTTKYYINLPNGMGVNDSARTLLNWIQLSPITLKVSKVTQQWVKSYGGFNKDTFAFVSAIDLYENIYISFVNLTGGYITLMKYTPNGSLRWVTDYDNNSYSACDMKISNNYHIYVLGENGYGYIILEYDSTGTLLGSNSLSENIPSPSYIDKPNLMLDSLENSYVNGYKISAKINNQGEIWSHTYNDGFYTNLKMFIDHVGDVYVTRGNTSYKYSANGTLLWTISSGGGDAYVDMKIDSSSNLYFVGSDELNGSIITKYNKFGVVQWVNEYDNAVTFSLNLDNSGHIYITYYDLILGGYSVLICNNNGEKIGQTVMDYDNLLNFGFYPQITQIDNNGGIYLCRAGYDNLWNTYLVKYQPDGSEQWEVHNASLNRGMIISPNNNIYITGEQFPNQSYTGAMTTVKYSQCPETANLLRTIKDNQTPKKSVLSVKDTDVNLYPNPNDGTFTLEVNLPSDGNVTLSAYDVLGESVLSEQLGMQKGNNKLSLKLNSNSKGIYFFNVVTATKTFNKKVIIE